MLGAVFVGRRDELAALGALLDTGRDAAATDCPGTRLGVVEGAAGMGKTTLVDQALQLFGAGWSVVRAAPTNAERDAAWGTVRLLLTGGLATLAAEHGLTVGGPLLWAAGLAPDGTPASDPTQATYAFVQLVEQLAERTRLVTVIDDAHWIDAASAAAIAFAIRSAGHWLLARRIGEGDRLEVAALVAEAAARTVSIAPFTSRDLDLLARHETGRVWNVVELEHLRELSGGNPLHARELLRAYPDGAMLVGGGRLPISLEELFGERVASLGGTELDVIATLALMRRPDLGELYDAFAELDGAVVEDALAAGERLGLLRVSPSAVEFEHALTRRAVVDRLGGVAQARLHRRLAAVAADVEARAWHLGQGTVGRDPVVAQALEDAGRHVHARGDTVQATELLSRAVEVTPRSDRDGFVRRSALAGVAATDAGDWARAVDLLEDVATEVTGPDGDAARNAYVIAVNRQLGIKPSLDAAEAMLPCYESADERVELLGKMTRLSLFVTTSDAESAALRTLADAESTADPRHVLKARLAHDHVRCLLGEHVDVATYAEQLAAYPERFTMAAIGHSGRQPLEELLQWFDVHDQARDLHNDAYEVGVATGSTRVVLSALDGFIGIERRSGRWADAFRWSAEYDAYVTGHNPELAGTPHADTVWLLAATGDHAVVRASVQQVVDDVAGVVPVGRYSVLADMGFALFVLGDLDPAIELLQASLDAAHEGGIRDVRHATPHADLVEALVLSGRIAEADAVAAVAEGIAARSKWPFSDLVATRCRAMVLLAQGDADGSVTELERDQPVWSQIPRPFEVARAWLLLGAARRRARQRTPASAALDRAAELFDELGSRPWSAKVADERRLLGRRGRAAVGEPTELSEAEQQVAALVSAGRSNKEIAAELFISLRTVESHLTRIYRKLGVRSRGEFLSRR